MIAIVDYGAANLLSITRALEACGGEVRVTSAPDEALAADGVVLPGVGAAGSAMQRLRRQGMDTALRQIARDGKPLLGLCLGMQLLFEELEEDSATGLGVLPGSVPKLAPGMKVPHMGWNTITWTPGARGTELFAGLEPGCHVYFVHSYHCVPADPRDTVAVTTYGGEICASVARDNTYGFQYHPEKSGEVGLRMLRTWLERISAAPRLAAKGKGSI